MISRETNKKHYLQLKIIIPCHKLSLFMQYRPIIIYFIKLKPHNFEIYQLIAFLIILLKKS